MQDRRRTVLVVDDDAAIRALVAGLIELERDDARVVMAGDGHAAVAVAARERPDLVVLDYMLPGQNGDAVLAALRARRPAPPAIGVSATPNPPGGFASSCDAFLRKPFSLDELADVVRRLLDGGIDDRRPRSSTAADGCASSATTAPHRPPP